HFINKLIKLIAVASVFFSSFLDSSSIKKETFNIKSIDNYKETFNRPIDYIKKYPKRINDLISPLYKLQITTFNIPQISESELKKLDKNNKLTEFEIKNIAQNDFKVYAIFAAPQNNTYESFNQMISDYFKIRNVRINIFAT